MVVATTFISSSSQSKLSGMIIVSLYWRGCSQRYGTFSGEPLYIRSPFCSSVSSDDISFDFPSGVIWTVITVYYYIFIYFIYLSSFFIICMVKSLYMGLRRLPCDLHDHLDGDAVVVILALQFLENNSENGRCA